MKPTPPYRPHAGAGCLEQPADRKKLKRIVLGLGPTLFSANVAHRFRQLGWEVLVAANGEEARRAAVRNCTHAVVIPYTPADPLATAKIVSAVPRRTQVVLLSGSEQAAQMAEMMGAGVVGGEDAEAVITEVVGRVCPAAN